MVKANAYGTGAVAATRALEAVDPWGYGVVTVEEGLALRQAGIRRPVIVFGPMTTAGVEGCLREELRPAIGDIEALRRWLAAGDKPFHLEIDSGMGRLGVHWRNREAIEAVAALLRDAAGWEGVFTHFHSADVDPQATRDQWTQFREVLAALPRRPALVHAANSAAALGKYRFPADLVRPGIFLYGGAAGAATPEVVVRLRAPVVAVRRLAAGDSVSYGATWHASRPTTIVTVAVGYADGVPRALGGRGQVEVLGRLCPIVGRVTMDFTMIDVGDLPVPCGEVVTIFGGAVSLDQQAAAAGTISYELLTGLGSRVLRRYGEEG